MLLSFSLIGSANAGNSNELRLHGNSTNKPAIDAIIKAFNATNPGIRITPTYYGVSDGQAAMMTQLLAGTAADILQAYPGYLQQKYFEKGWANTTDQMERSKDLLPSSKS